MSVRLTNGQMEVNTCGAWNRILSLGKYYGWKGDGTMLFYWQDTFEETWTVGRPADGPISSGSQWLAENDWNGSYIDNDGQVINRQDCWKLAMALENARDDIPDHVVDLQDEDLKLIALKMYHLSEFELENELESEGHDLICQHCLAYFTEPKRREIFDQINELMKNGPCSIY